MFIKHHDSSLTTLPNKSQFSLDELHHVYIKKMQKGVITWGGDWEP